MHTTPLTLLEKLRQPHAEVAWRRFVQLYTPLLHRWARRTGFAQNEALDLVQEVFAHLVQQLPHFHYDRSKKFRGWLRTLAVNKWKEIKRRRQDRAGPLPAELADPAADPADLFAEAEFQQILYSRALELMRTDFPGTTWQAAKAVILEGKTPGQAAAELGLSPGAVHAACFRVRARLREELASLL